MKSIDIIHGEHRALASALQPDFRLLASMVDYITQVPDKVHHPKEDNYLFPKMRLRSSAAGPLIDVLEKQHADGYKMTVGLLQALIHYQSMGAAGFASFDEVLQRYLDFSWAHLNQEEGELLPLARESLTAEDWQEIDAAFAANFDPYSGEEGEFEDLFGRIVNMTPAPYGLGSAP